MLRWILKIFLWSAIVFFGVTIGWVILYKWVNPPITLFHMMDRAKVEDCTYHYQWVDGDQISTQLKLAVVSSEDNHFMSHNGFDWEAIEKAQRYNETHKKKRGASTISQQTAKNVFLWPARSWLRKGLEAYFTVLIEFFWSKERILEMYLNVIEMGPCTYGVGAASELYFETTADQLTREQAALIASCLPNPKKFKLEKPSAYMQKRKRKIMRLMKCLGDDYFDRYGAEWSTEKRDKKEAEVDRALEKIPVEDLLVPVVDETNSGETPDTTVNSSPLDTLGQ
jgi:monofunctional biosynthetic peptidoglycan transglycosylase